VDRIYFDSTGPLEIRDEKLRRKILNRQSRSASTVAWNPWPAKRSKCPTSNDEYKQMVCVESGNVEGTECFAAGEIFGVESHVSSAAL